MFETVKYLAHETRSKLFLSPKMANFEINTYTKVFVMRLVMFSVYLLGGAMIFMWIENSNVNSSYFNDFKRNKYV